ncbi:lysosomal Pro-X carboxypeptidase-like [Prorops nasuta]|uniref:lysosomal Pro-X carboxypeptidase-like n=1 Tax=Prorops nasuta TaxID=863751 RepID=UPI0034CD45F8
MKKLVLLFLLAQELNFIITSNADNHQRNDKKYKYKIETFEVPLDHFSLTTNSTFKMRYLINNTWQKENDPPIFFYTGNEYNVEIFPERMGFMWEIAIDFNALLVFAEHRYYGESLPFGNDSHSSPKHIGYLTTQQAIADYVDLIEYFRSQQQYGRSPVIVFGGSYGGMLSAWMRMKYPHIVQGAIASSAPMLQFPDITDCNSFYGIVSSDFQSINSNCGDNIRKSWGEIKNLFSTENGRKWISETFKLCDSLKDKTDYTTFKDKLVRVIVDLAIIDYPYPSPANLLPLPANPIKAFCDKLSNSSLNGKALLIALKDAVNIHDNFTRDSPCLSTDLHPGDTYNSWKYQSCTEMVLPMCVHGDNSIFEPDPWDLQARSDECFKEFQVRPKANLICKQYGCKDLSAATNIVFSNGLRDPWSGGGVLRNLSDSAVAILIPEGAHELDFRASHENDPNSVTEARKYHRYSINKWIREYELKY